MEYWNLGVMEQNGENDRVMEWWGEGPNTPALQYSMTPKGIFA
jgi:hypothetical protein